MTFKKICFKIHKILGIVSGFVVSIVALTGCLWAFQPEIESLYDDYKHVEPQEQEFISPSIANDVAKGVYPDNTIYRMSYSGRDGAIQVMFYDGKPLFYRSVFLNPYSGEVLRVVDHTADFFALILMGHRSLWLPYSVGSKVIGSFVLIFLVVAVSGLIIWLPKRAKYLRKRLRFRWKKGTKMGRKLYDLHSILGVYTLLFAIIFAITGVVITFNWAKTAVYASVGGEKVLERAAPKSGDPTEGQADVQSPSVDRIFYRIQSENPDAAQIGVQFPRSEQGCITIEIAPEKNLYYNIDYRYFDQYTLEELNTPSIYGRHKDNDAADKLIRMNYDLHTGAIFGIWGRVLAFLASLIIAGMPITGYLMWWRKRR
ncbi:MAG: PepSY-associated TM helix domain-containing protein [Bacteroidales bacterium]